MKQPIAVRRTLDGVTSVAAVMVADDVGGAPLVLVVDDDTDIRILIAHVLERRGCRVLHAAEAATALELCDSHDLDLVLVDVGLPGMDGLDLLRAIKERLVDPDVPVVLVTARRLASDVATGLGLGATDYLRKPFEIPELLARVEAALKNKQRQDRLRQQNQELDRLTRTDVLTGAFNRRHLDDAIAAACRTAERYEDHIGILMIDIDHFKQVNDRYGHQCGDQVLEAVAERLQGELRAGDTLVRWGGDEFLVLLPRTNDVGAVAVAERLRARVGDEAFPVAGGAILTLTVSVGVASAMSPEPSELVAGADRALYVAKASGRNRVAGA
jgi:two-component system, cell cycle response regulator